MFGKVSDRAALTVKDAVLARSGVYIYSREEILSRGLKPVVDKPYYREYRPAGVLLAAKDKFNLVPVPKEHPVVSIDSSNFHTLASGVTGGPIDAVPREDGEIELRGKVAFFTRDAFDYYQSGCVETSAGYISKSEVVDNPDAVGYDIVLREIIDVNHLALVSRGRGGSDVRILDSGNIIDKSIGGLQMSKLGFLSWLGVGKQKDANFKLSQVVFDSVKKVGTLDAEALGKEIEGIVGTYIAPLGDGKNKEFLSGAVADSFKNPVEVMAKKDEVAKVIDGLYAKCQDADEKAAKEVLDTLGPTEDEETEDEKKKKKDADKENEKEKGKESVKDTAALVDEAITKALSGVTDSIASGIEKKLPALIDESVKRALGLAEKTSAAVTADAAGSVLDCLGESEDVSFLVSGAFAQR
jgi:hypothetical protein